eukprot:scaffold176433_cov26-Tisochrysis_lutea.AAC.2
MPTPIPASLAFEESRKAEKPSLLTDEAAMLATSLFGLAPIPQTIQPLHSYDDANFYLSAANGDSLLVPADANSAAAELSGQPGAAAHYVLKVHNGVESLDTAFIEAQNLAMLRVRGAGVWCPRALDALDGGLIARCERPLAGGGTRNHAVRLLPFRPDTVLGSDPALLTAPLLRQLGETAGKVTAALDGFDHPGAHRPSFIWDLARCLDLRPLLPSLPPERQDVIGAVLDEFEALVLPLAPQLPCAIVHGDINDQNVLVDPTAGTVTGLIDFGDMSYTWRVCEVAVAAAYVVIALHYGAKTTGADAPPEPQLSEEEAVSALISGYVAELGRMGMQLSEVEWLALPTLIAVRIAMSLTLGNYSSAKVRAPRTRARRRLQYRGPVGPHAAATR